jgi:hypothetical protein
MPLKRTDRHDIDRRELKLIRVGHYLWSLYRKNAGNRDMSEKAGLHRMPSRPFGG